jgi:hypothetical protein
MTVFRPTETEQFAIEAKRNLIFGAEIYDSLFLGFEVLQVVDDERRAWAPSEHCAAVIDVRYSGMVAWIGSPSVVSIRHGLSGSRHAGWRDHALQNLD